MSIMCVNCKYLCVYKCVMCMCVCGVCVCVCGCVCVCEKRDREYLEPLYGVLCINKDH